jgi:hypothetical protein
VLCDIRPAAKPVGTMNVLPAVQHCDHDTFHSGQGRYSHETGELRYVLVCEHCQAELRLVHVEAYRPNYDPAGGQRPRAA